MRSTCLREDILFCTYEKQLGYRLTAMTDRARTVECLFDYHPVLGQLQCAENALGQHDIEYLPSGRVQAERFRFGTHDKYATYAYTLLGLPATYTFVDGETSSLRYDECGRLARVENDTLEIEFAYDAFSRTRRIKTESTDGGRSMDMSLAYDDGGREIERVLVSVEWGGHGKTDAGPSVLRPMENSVRGHGLRKTDSRTESYDYDIRGRLREYACTGSHAPIDPWGLAIAGQRFTFDALDNMLTLETTYADVSTLPRKSSFHYAPNDPTQLIRIERVQGASEEIVPAGIRRLREPEVRRGPAPDGIRRGGAAGPLDAWKCLAGLSLRSAGPGGSGRRIGPDTVSLLPGRAGGLGERRRDVVIVPRLRRRVNLAQCTSDAVGTDTVPAG